MRLARLVALVVSIAIVAPMTVGAAIPRPIPVAPKNRASLPAGKTPTFKVRSSGKGTVWVHVSKSAHRDADGIIGTDASIGQAHKSHGVFVYKPKFFSYPAFWANQKRKWYWQSYRISCGEETKSTDCKVEGPIRTFRLH